MCNAPGSGLSGHIARKLDISVPDEAALTDKVKKMILEWRDESFDKSYVNNQFDAQVMLFARLL
ncbi:hypothetical protein N430_02431 [Pseudomonas sp. CC120222-01a]|nr:hypothetical protein N430_02431 [Pseudomonas sp. CC120222-01a]